MIDPTMTPGTFVTHPDHPEWGLGQIQSAIGPKVTVNFEHLGKVVLDLRHTRLTTSNLPPTKARD